MDAEKRRTHMDYQELIEWRRAFHIPLYKSLADIGMDGPWVTPYQISSNSPDGPLLLALHLRDEETITDRRLILSNLGADMESSCSEVKARPPPAGDRRRRGHSGEKDCAFTRQPRQNRQRCRGHRARYRHARRQRTYRRQSAQPQSHHRQQNAKRARPTR